MEHEVQPQRPSSRARLVCWLALVGAIAALEYAARFSSSGPSTDSSRDEVYRYSTFASGVVFYALIFGVLLAIAYERTDLFALRRPRGRVVPLVVLLFVGIFAWESVVVVLPIRNPGNEQGLTPTHWESAHAAAFALNLVLFAVVAPIVEELTFRGVGQSLLRFTGRWPSIVLVAILFGIWHGLVQALIVLIPFGGALAYLRDRTRSVLPGIVLHALFNATALALSVAG
jgi:membrane protease YdiL (CAAX protease family)